MEKRPPMDKLFDSARNRAKLKQLKEKLAQKEFVQAEKILQQYQLGEQVNSDSDSEIVPEAEEARQQPPPEMVEPEAPTYKDMARDAALKHQYVQQRPKIKKTDDPCLIFFREHCSRDVFSRILADEPRMRQLIRGVREEIVVLDCGIRNFSSTVREIPPDRVVSLLQAYLGDIIPVIVTEYGGCIGEVTGAGVTAYFGLPYKDEWFAASAAGAATAIMRRLATINEQLARQGLPAIGLSLGLALGPVCAGFPVTEHLEGKFMVSGDAVFMARELQRVAAFDEILAGPRIATQIKNKCQFEPVGITIEFIDRTGILKNYSANRIVW